MEFMKVAKREKFSSQTLEEANVLANPFGLGFGLGSAENICCQFKIK